MLDILQGERPYLVPPIRPIHPLILVINRRDRPQWNLREWRIWGHATPTTVEDLDSPFFAPGLTLSERMDAMKDMMTGKKMM